MVSNAHLQQSSVWNCRTRLLRHRVCQLLSKYGSRGQVEPLVGLAVRLRALGPEVWVCAPPDFAELQARVGVPLVLVGVQR
jgi:hypothetical protein